MQNEFARFTIVEKKVMFFFTFFVYRFAFNYRFKKPFQMSNARCSNDSNVLKYVLYTVFDCAIDEKTLIAISTILDHD